jgi:hypothetical protein
VWGTQLGYPGAVIRLSPGANPPETALTEIYRAASDKGYSPRGGDVDRNGVYWAAMASGHLASFDRRKCKGPLNGPNATGQHCPKAGRSTRSRAADQRRDRFGQRRGELLHVGRSVRHARARSEHADRHGQRRRRAARAEGRQVRDLRVPYPLGFYTKWMDGRIDDPNGGWKGRGVWSTVSTRAPFHMETGRGTTSKVMHFQIRPEPLAK